MLQCGQFGCNSRLWDTHHTQTHKGHVVRSRARTFSVAVWSNILDLPCTEITLVTLQLFSVVQKRKRESEREREREGGRGALYSKNITRCSIRWAQTARIQAKHNRRVNTRTQQQEITPKRKGAGLDSSKATANLRSSPLPGGRPSSRRSYPCRLALLGP